MHCSMNFGPPVFFLTNLKEIFYSTVYVKLFCPSPKSEDTNICLINVSHHKGHLAIRFSYILGARCNFTRELLSELQLTQLIIKRYRITNRSFNTTKDMRHAGCQISLLSSVYKRRKDSTAFIANAGESSVGKFLSRVSTNAGEISKPQGRSPT